MSPTSYQTAPPRAEELDATLISTQCQVEDKLFLDFRLPRFLICLAYPQRSFEGVSAWISSASL